MKICNKCHINKDDSEFWNGYYSCKACEKIKGKLDYIRDKEKIAIYHKKYYQEHKQQNSVRCREYRETHKEEQTEYKYKKLRNIKNAYRTWARETIRTHKSRNHIVDITYDELEQLAKESPNCKICDKPILWGYGHGFTHDSPTLDRINNESNMNLSNVWILCRDCNSMKLNKPIDEYVEYCKMIVEKFDKK